MTTFDLNLAIETGPAILPVCDDVEWQDLTAVEIDLTECDDDTTIEQCVEDLLAYIAKREAVQS